ncbi:MAG: PAS domain-containing protein [Haloferacaceae archaeon]
MVRARAAPSSLQRPVTVLLVGEVPGEGLPMRLSESGFRVDHATTASAIRARHDGRYDCVVWTSAVADADSLALLDDLHDGIRAPVVFLSTDDDAAAALDAGADDCFLYTPDSERRLAARVSTLAWSASASFWDVLAMLDAALGALRGAYLLFDGDGRLVLWNEAVRTLTGLTPDGRSTTSDLFADDDCEDVATAVASALAGDPTTVDASLVTAEGDAVDVDVTTARLDDCGPVVAVCRVGYDVNDHDARLRSLRTSQRDLRALLECPWTLTAVLSPDGDVRRVNRSIVGLVDEGASGVVESSFAELSWWRREGTDRRRIRNAVERAARGNRVRFEAQHRTPDGEYVTVEFVLRPIGSDGGVDAIVAVGRDVTEVVRLERDHQLLLDVVRVAGEAGSAEDALRRTIERVCAETRWVYGEAWVPTEDGTALERVTGHACEEAFERFVRESDGMRFEPGEGLVGRVWQSAEPEWMPDVSAASADAFGRTDAAERAGLRAGLAVPIVAEDRVVAVLGFFMRERHREDRHHVDVISTIGVELGGVVARKRVEDTLSRERALLDRVFETSPVALLVLAPDGSILRANSRAEAVFGLARSELVERTYDAAEWDVVDEMGRPLPSEELPFHRVGDTGDPVFDYEHGIEAPDGTRMWLSVNAVPLFDDDGNVERIVTAVDDVTDRREYERRLRNQAERLSVLNRVLRHDIRTKANIVSGYADLVRRDPTRIDEGVENVRETTAELVELSDKIRKLERTIAKSGATGRYDVVDAVERALTNVDAAGRDASFEVDLPAAAWTTADERFEFAVEELLENAVEHGGDAPTVSVSVRSETRRGRGEVVVRVADDGPGIPEHERRVLEREGETPLEHASGYGLWLVKWAVTTLDGTLDIDERERGGTVVTIRVAARE